MTIRLGSKAPNFVADSSKGPINFYEWAGNSWVLFFSHPDDFTPVCTTELGAMSQMDEQFTSRGVKLLGLSANTADSHNEWVKDINEISNSIVQFPIIADADRRVSVAYDMLDFQDATNVDSHGIQLTIRSVFIIDPNKTVRLILAYPASTGRNMKELLRVIDALQASDQHGISTPVNWQSGEEVIIPPTVSDDEARHKYGTFRKVKDYLRFKKIKANL